MGEKKKIGRPKENLYKKYVEGREEELLDFCREGADLSGIANFLGMGLTTLKRIKKEYPKLAEIIKEGGAVADDRVESELYKRAIGYEAEDTSTEVKVSPDGSAQTTFVRKNKRHIPGEVSAMIFWLKNRRPERWRDKQDVELNSLQPISISISKDERTNSAAPKDEE